MLDAGWEMLYRVVLCRILCNEAASFNAMHNVESSWTAMQLTVHFNGFNAAMHNKFHTLKKSHPCNIIHSKARWLTPALHCKRPQQGRRSSTVQLTTSLNVV